MFLKERLALEVLGIPRPFLQEFFFTSSCVSTGSEVQETSAHAALYTCYSDHKTTRQQNVDLSLTVCAFFFKGKESKKKKKKTSSVKMLCLGSDAIGSF